MRLPLIAIAGLLTIASAGFAERPKPAPAKPAQRQRPPVQVVLASADTVPSAPENAKVAQAPIKRPVAPRVTACRCGDPNVDAEVEQQQ